MCRNTRYPKTVGLFLMGVVIAIFSNYAKPQSSTFSDVTPTSTPASVGNLFPLLQVYEFDKNTLDENGWAEIPGGFTGQKPVMVAFINFSADFIPSSQDKKGMALTVNPGGVAFVYAKAPIRTGGAPVMLRMTVRADKAEAAVALVALKGNMITQELLDGSIATHIPASAASFQNAERRIVLVYEPDQGDQVTPVIQVAATGKNTPVTVVVDRLEFFKLDAGFFGALGHTAQTPTATPINTFTPVPPTPTQPPTPTWSPTPVSVPSGQTITIPLDLPAGAKPLEMVLIPAGMFLMGSPDSEWGRGSYEGPQHQVTLTKAFYLGKYEVTQAQWQAVMGSNPSSRPYESYGIGSNYPVYYVSWYDCQTFIQKLNLMGQGTFRLPTEAEWEYACRAGITTRFYWGDDPNYTQIKNYAWYYGNSPNGTHEVGLKLPNAWGLFDMSGNLYEWCQDWYGSESYSSNDQVDPIWSTIWLTRVIRGGCWSTITGNCRSAYRDGGRPGDMSFGIGFRLTRTQDSQPNQIPTPIPTPIATNTPTPPPTWTPIPVSVPSGQTITIPLDLPAGAKPLEMVLIPAGTFMMGSLDSEKKYDQYSNEGPQHKVTISKDFYMGKYEVTQAQWQAVMGNNPSFFSGNPNNPVEGVSWNDCQPFIQKLNRMGQGTFRLPTEAEWEYAGRAGTTTWFYWGDDPNYIQISQYAWYTDNSGVGTHEVGLKLPNAWGLFDMSGNVWEWCQDWYGSYSSNDQVDPICSTIWLARVIRGGGWMDPAGNCRSALRSNSRPDSPCDSIGFRLVAFRTQ